MAIWLIEVEKALETNLEGTWKNDWEAMTIDDDIASISDIANVIVNAERKIHLDAVRFLQWTAKAYNPGTGTFNPALSPSQTINQLGQRASTGQDLYDLEMCYQWRINTNSRAYGKKMFRGCLLEVDVNTLGKGRAQLNPGSGLQPTGVDGVAFTATLAEFLNQGLGANQICCYTRFQTSPRGAEPKVYGPWAAYAAVGIGYRKLGNVAIEHEWFNRSS